MSATLVVRGAYGRSAPPHWRAVAQQVVGEHDRHHGFADRHGTDADTRIVAALGDDLRLVAPAHRWSGAAYRIDEVGLTANRQTTGCPVEMPPRIPPAWLERKRGLPSGTDADLVGIGFARELGRRHAGADLDAFHRIDAHHRRREVLVELAVDRRAEARRHARRATDLDHGADRGARLAHAVEIVRPLGHRAGIRAEERVGSRPRPSPTASGRP